MVSRPCFVATTTTSAGRLAASSATERAHDDDDEPGEEFANDNERTEKKKKKEPEILQPFPEAADPSYRATGSIGLDEFVVSRTGGPSADELRNENLLRIVLSECNDLEVNTLVWKCLGYRFDETKLEWTTAEVFPKWKEKYPEPPDLIGMRRIYAKEVDQPSLRANQALVRSIPLDNKQSLKKQLKPLGWKGYQYSELTPNKTRRAQCANWLVYYREELFGYTVEELRERRRRRQEEEQQQKLEEKQQQQKQDRGDEWKPPLKEVF